MRLWTDSRIGGLCYFRLLSPAEVPMQVPDEIRKCVCFVYSKEPDERLAPRGTAFFVSVARGGGHGGTFVYLVTARHVLTRIDQDRPDGTFRLRLNSVQGGVLWVETNVEQWHTHPDVTLVDDAAVMPWAPPAEQVDYRTYPLESVATEQVIRDQAIGTGDEVFLPGLFVSHTGIDRNIPIVRIGNIAAMPDEPVETRIGALDAYLVEARSIGGLSGSPVFVNAGASRQIGGNTVFAGGPMFYLLGLMHGHYTVDVGKVGAAKTDDLSDEAINMGIAVVLPVTRVLDVINSEELTKMRREADEAEVTASLPTLDSAETPPESEYERFEDLTHKLVNVPKKEIDEKRKDGY